MPLRSKRKPSNKYKKSKINKNKSKINKNKSKSKIIKKRKI